MLFSLSMEDEDFAGSDILMSSHGRPTITSSWKMTGEVEDLTSRLRGIQTSRI